MKANKTKISVIMPVYNSGIYLNTAVESILNQSFEDFELILVDDGSTDGSSEKCDEYALKDSRVVVIHQENRGICNARNAALEIAQGEYIAFSDHDDEYSTDLLNAVYKRAKQDNADIVKFCKRELIIVDGVIVRTRETKLSNVTLPRQLIKKDFLTLLNQKILDCVWDSLIRRDVLASNAILFDEKYKVGGEDIDFIIRVLSHVEVFSMIDKCYYTHYIRRGFSTSAKFNLAKLETTTLLAKRITIEAREMGIDLYEKKKEYLYQITYILLNCSAALLSDRKCKMTFSEKINYLESIREVDFLPMWFFSQSANDIKQISKRYAFSFYLFKHKMYPLLLMMSKMREIQLDVKKYLLIIENHAYKKIVSFNHCAYL